MKVNLIKNELFKDQVRTIMEQIINGFSYDYKIKKEFQDDVDWYNIKSDVECDLENSFDEDDSFEYIWDETYNQVKEYVDIYCELRETE